MGRNFRNLFPAFALLMAVTASGKGPPIIAERISPPFLESPLNLQRDASSFSNISVELDKRETILDLAKKVEINLEVLSVPALLTLMSSVYSSELRDSGWLLGAPNGWKYAGCFVYVFNYLHECEGNTAIFRGTQAY